MDYQTLDDYQLISLPFTEEDRLPGKVAAGRNTKNAVGWNIKKNDKFDIIYT